MEDCFPVGIRSVHVITAVCANLPNPLLVASAQVAEAADAAVVAVAVAFGGSGIIRISRQKCGVVLVGAAAGAVAVGVGGVGVVVGRRPGGGGGRLVAVPVEPVLEQRGHVHVDAAVICGGGSGQFRARGPADMYIHMYIRNTASLSPGKVMNQGNQMHSSWDWERRNSNTTGIPQFTTPIYYAQT